MSDRRDVQSTSPEYIIRDDSDRPRTHPRAPAFKRSRATQLVPRMDLLAWILALDAEFQIIYDEESKTNVSVIGRISVVNYDGKVVYDVFVYFPEEPGRTIKLPPSSCNLGVYWKDIRPGNGAIPVAEALETIGKIIDGKVVVGHSIYSDIDAIDASRSSGDEDILKKAWSFRDTQGHMYYRGLLGNDQPGLKKLYKRMVGKDIQGIEHTSVEDAQATMELYRLREAEIEREQANWDFWLEPRRSEDDILDEIMNGPDYTWGPPAAKRLPKQFQVKKEQEALDVVAKEYREAQAQKPLPKAALVWKTFKKDDTKASAATSNVDNMLNTFGKSPASSTSRKDSFLSSSYTTSEGTNTTMPSHSKTSSLASSLNTTSASMTSACPAQVAATAPIQSASKGTVFQAPTKTISAAKRNAMIKIAYPLAPTSSSRQTAHHASSNPTPVTTSKAALIAVATPLASKAPVALKSWSQAAHAGKDMAGSADTKRKNPDKIVFRKRT